MEQFVVTLSGRVDNLTNVVIALCSVLVGIAIGHWITKR